MKEIYVCNECGRLVRPVFKVKNNKILLTKKMVEDLKDDIITWRDLIVPLKTEESIIEYIDIYYWKCTSFMIGFNQSLDI